MRERRGSSRFSRAVVVCAVACAVTATLSTPAMAQDVVNIVNDRMGIGTATPGSKLEIQSTADDAKIRVQESNGTVIKRFLLELANNGAPQFMFTDTSTDTNWQFSMLSNGNFAVDRLGDTGAELLIRTDGSVKMGPGGSQKFAMDPSGNVTIAGTLTELSDVNAKTAFQVLDAATVLQKVVALPVMAWTYREDPTDSRHVGPTAQDFFSAFGLGADNRHIAPRDMAAVGLIAAKALYDMSVEREAVIDELRRENERLADRLEKLEQRLNSIE